MPILVAIKISFWTFQKETLKVSMPFEVVIINKYSERKLRIKFLDILCKANSQLLG